MLDAPALFNKVKRKTKRSPLKSQADGGNSGKDLEPLLWDIETVNKRQIKVYLHSPGTSVNLER